MPLLEAFLALALTLLSLAMIATLIVELIHRIAGTRAENLRMMLEQFYDVKLKAIVEAKSAEGDKKNEPETMVGTGLPEGDEKNELEADEPLEDKMEFIRKLMGNPLIKEEGQAGPVKSNLKGYALLKGFARRIDYAHLKGCVRSMDYAHLKGQARRIGNKRLKDLGSLSPEDLFKGLASTKIGKRIKAKTEAEIDEAVDSLSRSYDEIGVAATDLFKRRAQIVSLLAGVLVAFALNANALQIFNSYLDNPQARATVVARADAALEDFTKAADSTKKTDNIEAYKTKEEFVKDVNSIRNEIKKLADMGIPIGYGVNKVPVDWPENSIFPRWLEIVFWVLGVFATGLLIGLGGPFWFNVVRKLTDILQVVRGGAPAAAGPGDSAGGPADPIKSNRDTFKTAGGLPPLVKAQAKLTAAIKAAADADKAVKAAVDALMGTRKAAGNEPDELMKVAVEQTEEALKMVTDAQKKAHDLKNRAEQSMPQAD